ncbi:MAG: hypothetical protein AAGE86_07740 [Pseudomonadota bacterium]
MNYEVFALEVSPVSESQQIELQGDAAYFAPHISVLPRTVANRRTVARLAETLANAEISGSIVLMGPVDVSKNLRWFECLPEFKGFAELCRLHEDLLEIAREDGAKVNEEYCNTNYRPHLTIASGVECAAGPCCARLEVSIIRAVRYCISRHDVTKFDV